MQPHRYSNPELQLVPGVRQHAFLFQEFEKPRFDFVWHLHPEFELTYIQRGYGVRYAGRSILPFYERDLCLLGGNLPHAYGSHPRHSDSCAWIVIHFLPEVWGEAFWHLPENKSVLALMNASQMGLRFHGKGLAEVEKDLRALQALPRGDERTLPLFLQTLQAVAAVERRDFLNTEPEPGENHADPRIGRVLQWLENHAAEKVSQADAARQIGMSPVVFSRFFHQKTGRLFSRHLNEMRIARACASLANSEKTIAEIAFESGFNNLANFNRRFAELLGMPPREYRKHKS